MGRSDGNSSFLVLKLACICFCLLSVVSLTPGFRSAQSPSHVRDFVSLLNAVIFAVGFYGIHKRTRLTWQLGWFIGGFLFVEWLVFCLMSSLKQPSGWIASNRPCGWRICCRLILGVLVETPKELLYSRLVTFRHGPSSVFNISLRVRRPTCILCDSTLCGSELRYKVWTRKRTRNFQVPWGFL
jgi:hypothetical protein